MGDLVSDPNNPGLKHHQGLPFHLQNSTLPAVVQRDQLEGDQVILIMSCQGSPDESQLAGRVAGEKSKVTFSCRCRGRRGVGGIVTPLQWG